MDDSKTLWMGENGDSGAIRSVLGRLFSRLTSLALDLLETRGAFQFAYVCLGLMSVLVGLTFQRAIQDTAVEPRGGHVAGAFAESGFAVIVWFWFFMVASTIAGAVFLRLFRDEIRQCHAPEVAERRADFLASNDPVAGLVNGTFFQDRLCDLAMSC